MMPEDIDQTAAAYTLGILRGAARAAIEARLSSDPALQAKINSTTSSTATTMRGRTRR